MGGRLEGDSSITRTARGPIDGVFRADRAPGHWIRWLDRSPRRKPTSSEPRHRPPAEYPNGEGWHSGSCEWKPRGGRVSERGSIPARQPERRRPSRRLSYIRRSRSRAPRETAGSGNQVDGRIRYVVEGQRSTMSAVDPIRPHRSSIGPVVLNMATVLAWVGIPILLLERAGRTSNTDSSNGLGTLIAVAMGIVALVLVIASYVLARGASSFRPVIVNIAVQLIFLVAIPLIVIYPAVSVFVFVPVPALLWSAFALLSGSTKRP